MSERNARVTGWVIPCPICGDTYEYPYDPTGHTERCRTCGDPYNVIAVSGVGRDD